MRVKVHERGGLAGLDRTTLDLDSASMPREKARLLERILSEAGFVGLAATPTKETIGADMMQTEITVLDGERRHVVRFADDGRAALEPLRDLLRRLRDLG